MVGTTWSVGPFGLDGATRSTWSPQRTVLVVIHHLTAGTRLADVVPLLESDPRLQIAYTVPPTSPFHQSGSDYARSLDGLVLPWDQATSLRFDLAVAAHHGGLDRLHAPVLTLHHGCGPTKLVPQGMGHGPRTPREVTGAVVGSLISYGRVVPSVIGLGHERHRALLARAVPAAADIARVVGDPCFDRITASLPRRDTYRRALGVVTDQRLIVVSSTFRPHSLLGRHPQLPAWLSAELDPQRFRVVVVPHPGTWAWHGRRQVRAWLNPAPGADVGLIPPEEGWRAAVVASDLVIGDHGSVTYYAAASGRPVLLGTFPTEDVDPASHVALLGMTAPRLVAEASLPAQVDAAIAAHVPDRTDWYRDMLTSAPGRSARLLRTTMYEMLDLPEPDTPVRTHPVPPPHLVSGEQSRGRAA
ncbi:hypothetical protein CDO52_14850 [Nocardiopsis gilva YIM 90087]|uniref:Uncharacterized protein n=1 Tax=Nocardiopsis gilva YIM 90087 TaxID=1235441 RepID=A0A223S6Z0_9ACTN|nr:hypothetical protein [Nocardiopsis gilva]ASU83890.1 hypothetical protein CDO52_14850 [Nocardiopsis gilva YIM 90087]